MKDLKQIDLKQIEDLDTEYNIKLLDIEKKLVGDLESRHIMEDEILLEILKNLGFKKVINQFNRTEKWYS